MLEVLDTAGQEDYVSLRDQWIRDGEGFVLVYSISSRASFQQLKSFYNQIRRVKDSSGTSGPDIPAPVMLVGNKCDRVTEREVSTQEGTTLARELGCEFIEASAKNCVNVEKAFYDVVRQLRRQRMSSGSGGATGNSRESSRRKNNASSSPYDSATRNGRSKSKGRGSKCVIL